MDKRKIYGKPINCNTIIEEGIVCPEQATKNIIADLETIAAGHQVHQSERLNSPSEHYCRSKIILLKYAKDGKEGEFTIGTLLEMRGGAYNTVFIVQLSEQTVEYYEKDIDAHLIFKGSFDIAMACDSCKEFRELGNTQKQFHR